ncbi:MAG: bile acid:sodium symporter family protein [Bacteriovoracaceae bacterium]|nr:bile acid:sodium symporter family protein [Bacteriovoracaceae bacterium]
MNVLTQVLLPLILAFIMFSMGLSLVIDDFKRVAKYPKAFVVGLLLQVITLPLLGFLVATVWTNYFGLNPVYAAGLIIIAACPGGVTSNLMTHLGKGDTALSISLTAVISFLTVITLPIIVNLGLSNFMGSESDVKLNVIKTVVGIFVITSVPVIIGMVIKAKNSSLADKIEPLCRKLATFFFIAIVLVAVAKDFKLLMESISTIGPSALTLNILTMVLAYGASRLLTLSKEQSRAITFECGLQNGTLAIFIAVTLLGDERMMLPGVVYGLLMFVTGGIYLFKLLHKDKRTIPAPSL